MTSTLNLTASPEAPAGFPYVENHVRARMGISKDEIRRLRQSHLTEGTDWCLKKKRVWLAQSAVDGLLKAKALPPALKRPDAQTANAVDSAPVKAMLPEAGRSAPSTTAPPAAAVSQKNAALKSEALPAGAVAAVGTVELIVVQLTKNPHIVQCCGLKDNPRMPKTMVRVRVKSAKNFKRYMRLPAVLVEGYTDLYDLARACPKHYGKW